MLQFLMTMLGALSFAILFHAPKQEYIFCSLTGAFGWTAYLIFANQGFGITFSSLFSTFIMSILARLLSAVRKCPATVFLITGIFTLVPGAGIYYTAYYLIMGNVNDAILKGIETFKIAGAIVLGIVFGSAVPQLWFHKTADILKRQKVGILTKLRKRKCRDEEMDE